MLSDAENLPDASTSHVPTTGLVTVPLMVNVSPSHWTGASPLLFAVLSNDNAHGPVGLPVSSILQITSAFTLADYAPACFSTTPGTSSRCPATVTPSDFETDDDT